MNKKEQMFVKLKTWAKEYRFLELDVASLEELLEIKVLALTYAREGSKTPFSLPPEIILLENLTKLEIHVDITELPSEMVKLAKLRSLLLASKNISALPEWFGDFRQLRYLKILRTYSFKEFPSVIGKLKNLKRLEFSSEDFTDLPDSIGDLQNLRYLEIHNPAFKELPLCICRLKNLKVLILKHHTIRDFPPQIGNLKKLTVLFTPTYNLIFSIDSAHGPFPKEIANLKKLRYLCCDVREITEEICNLESLKYYEYGAHTLKSLPPSIDKILSLGFIKVNKQRGYYTLNTLKDKNLLHEGFNLVKTYEEVIEDKNERKTIIHRYNKAPLITSEPLTNTPKLTKEEEMIQSIVKNMEKYFNEHSSKNS